MGIELRYGGAVIQLPNPELGDSEKANDTINVQRSMTGVLFTYVKTKKVKTLKYTFSLNRDKYYALLTFYIMYCAQPIQLVNWKGEVWIGYILNDTLDNTENRQWDNIVELEFEGVKVN